MYKHKKQLVRVYLGNPKNRKIFWDIELIVGPFAEQNAIEYEKKWNYNSRGIESRRIRGLTLFSEAYALDNSLRCYDKRLIPLKPSLEEWLRHHKLEEYILPKNYMAHLQRLVLQEAVSPNANIVKMKWTSQQIELQ